MKGPVSGFVGCQHWTAEFKGITQPVFLRIFFYDFVTPQKRKMSEGCSLFTLKKKKYGPTSLTETHLLMCESTFRLLAGLYDNWSPLASPEGTSTRKIYL